MWKYYEETVHTGYTMIRKDLLIYWLRQEFVNPTTYKIQTACIEVKHINSPSQLVNFVNNEKENNIFV